MKIYLKRRPENNAHTIFKLLLWLLLLLTSFAASTGQHKENKSNTWVLREDGIGPVKIGMTLSELNSVLHEETLMTDDKDNEGCFYVKPKKLANALFMIIDGRLARIDVDGLGITTERGILVGDSESHTLRVYGPSVKVVPNIYTDGHYLTVRSRTGEYGIRFETDKGKIERFYAGEFTAIQFVEGCQ